MLFITGISIIFYCQVFNSRGRCPHRTVLFADRCSLLVMVITNKRGTPFILSKKSFLLTFTPLLRVVSEKGNLPIIFSCSLFFYNLMLFITGISIIGYRQVLNRRRLVTNGGGQILTVIVKYVIVNRDIFADVYVYSIVL